MRLLLYLGCWHAGNPTVDGAAGEGQTQQESRGGAVSSEGEEGDITGERER